MLPERNETISNSRISGNYLLSSEGPEECEAGKKTILGKQRQNLCERRGLARAD